ncbi:metalloregulator ArsR/SmtB family transcription factor [Halobacillus sp. BBL2006]|uniref:ArsR/SmtB family transcription factor n=1 Tax=Halobacillus sp. BBL2006 TaxID=1543706 RepID=UPI000543261D|nr:metalloregulator ArsR/SmtB family transcription factor [Halobacillus sp. BBL2006]KHE72131.1 ArsR family transcriptional regulator [Halobacillus sp. BBL2006]
MELFSTSTKGRETYRIELKQSLLWETALGLAAITNDALIQTLEYPKEKWEEVRNSLSPSLEAEVQYVREKNTWKTLLQLLHQKDFQTMDEFRSYIKELPQNDLRLISIPYLGEDYQHTRSQAAQGSIEAVKELQKQTKDNSFFSEYIAFICAIDVEKLKDHLIKVMAGWLETVIKPNQEDMSRLLSRDVELKNSMAEKLEAEAFVEWATHGVTYRPEPSVYKVIMIPQYIYRPWNVEADIEGAKVFYYPVANESIQPNDPYVPNQMLVQKYKALGDEIRLRMLKILSERSMTLQEMTERLEMGKTTIHHHLKLLKSARLVAASSSRYELNVRALTTLPKELQVFLENE